MVHEGSLSLVTGSETDSHKQEETGNGWRPLPHNNTNSHLDLRKDQMSVVKISEPGISGEGQDKIVSQASLSREQTSAGELMRL